jgi:hypothetical protein
MWRAATQSIVLSAGCFLFLASDASALSCRSFRSEVQRAIAPPMLLLRRYEIEASDRLKGLDTRPFAFLRDESRKVVATIADPAALKDEEELSRCRNATSPIRRICADATQMLLDILDRHVASGRPDYDKASYASAIADCEKHLDLKPLKTILRGTD